MKAETLSDEKLDLIVRISKLDDEESVRQVKNAFDVVEKRQTQEQLELLKKIAKPIREKLDVEQLKKEQNWKPPNKEKINRIIENFDWQISDEDFIELLKDI